MKNIVRLNRRELVRLYELFNKLHESGDYNSVILCEESGSGIGALLTATFVITHKDVEGEFTCTISDESNW